MNSINKQRIMNHLSYSWYVYLIVAIVITFGWYQAFYHYFKTKPNEKFSIYIISTKVDTVRLDADLTVKLVDETLKEIHIDYDSIDNPSLHLLLSTKGLVNTDLLILPESVAEELNVLYEFAQIDQDYLSSFMSESVEYLQVNQFNIGLLIHGDKISILDDYITYSDEQYYLFFNRKSVHLNEQNYAGSDMMINVLKILFEVEGT